MGPLLRGYGITFTQVSGGWLSCTQEGATDSASSTESPPLTPLLVSMGNDDENKSDESSPSEETFVHQLDDIDTNDGNYFFLFETKGFISLSQQINFQVAYQTSIPDHEHIEVWNVGEDEVDLIADIEPESNQENSIHSSVLSTWLIAFLLYMQVAFRLPDRAVSAILAFLIKFWVVLVGIL